MIHSNIIIQKLDILAEFNAINDGQLYLLYDWRESCLLIGPICLDKSLCVPGNWSEPVHKLILHENRLELVSRS